MSKVIVTTCSAGAALVSILSYAQSHGLIMQPAGNGQGAASGAGANGVNVGWIGIAPVADTATSIGDTLHLTARVADHKGGTILGAEIAWSSDSAAVAAVSDDGTVVAKGPGTTTIYAAAGAKVARARVTVRQRVVGARILGDSAVKVPVGERIQLREQGIDARGHAVERHAVVWRSADTTVARVDSLGRTRGVAPGRTTLTAVVDGISTQLDVEVMDVPATIALVDTTARHALAGRAVPRPLEVEALSSQGRPVAGAIVRFGAEGDAGRTEPATAMTDAKGRARVKWILGDAPGPQTLTVSVDLVTTPVVARAEAEPVPANTRTSPLSEMATGRVAEEVQDEVGLRVTDSLGRALPDVPVTWTARDGGTVVAASERTDSLGQSRIKWTLGPRAGVQHAVATIGSGRSVPRVTIGAAAVAGPVASIVVASGGAQSAGAGSTLPRPIVLRAVDLHGNPVPDVAVSLVPAHGSVADSALVTDTTGAVRVSWTLGRSAGAQRLLARAAGVATPLSLGATARPLAVANVAFPDTTIEGRPGRPLAAPIGVAVTDAYGNPVPDALVTFRADKGSVSTARVMTDANGRAATRWRLGAQEGEQHLTASVKGIDTKSTLTVNAGASAAVAPAYAAHDAQSKPAVAKTLVAKPATKPETRPATKSASKPAAKASSSKTTSKSTSKPATKSATSSRKTTSTAHHKR